VANTDNVDDGFAAVVVKVPITTNDSFEYVLKLPSFVYPKELETVYMSVALESEHKIVNPT